MISYYLHALSWLLLSNEKQSFLHSSQNCSQQFGQAPSFKFYPLLINNLQYRHRTMSIEHSLVFACKVQIVQHYLPQLQQSQLNPSLPFGQTLKVSIRATRSFSEITTNRIVIDQFTRFLEIVLKRGRIDTLGLDCNDQIGGQQQHQEEKFRPVHILFKIKDYNSQLYSYEGLLLNIKKSINIQGILVINLALEVISLLSRKMIRQVSSPQIKIYIRLHNGNGSPLTVQPSIHFYQLIKIINKMQLQLPELYTIVFKGKHIKNYQLTLHQLTIAQNSILHIEEAADRSPRSINMDVCVCYNQQNFVVKSTLTDTVLILKQTIYKLTKVSPKHQILVFNGNKLDNQYTLQSYRICPNSLICLISTVKMPEPSQVHSDYDQVINNFLQNQTTLLDSVISLCDKKQQTKISLFRSENTDRKNLLLCSPIQVEIKQRSINEDNDSEQSGKDFNFDLFKSFGMSKPMTLSLGFNLFDSLKHPIKIRNFILKDDDQMKENNILDKEISIELVSSTKSFRL